MKRARIESPVNHVDVAEQQLRSSKVSRKVQACTECRTRKIKCDISPPEKATCSRCYKKGLRCVVNKSLQSLLEEETEWKRSVQENSECLKSAISKILSVLNLPPLESFSLDEDFSQPTNNDGSERPGNSKRNRTMAMAMSRENSQDLEAIRNEEALVSAPMRSLFEVTKLRNLRSQPHRTPKNLEEDFISRGKISEREAEAFFRRFNTSFNHYLWGGIALVHETLSSVRQSSSLLLSAILTVTALHIPGKEKLFEICYAEFLTTVSDSMFDKYHNLDGIRGLCIGAFWLSDLSWKLSGHAVRIATELNLHQSYTQAIKGSHQHVEAARLWYFLYVCEHHFSIAYGRPPVIHNDQSINSHEQFLLLPGITQSDYRLHSQIAIFIILTDFYNAFGPDIEQMVSEEDLVRLRHFNTSLDRWRLDWETRLASNPHIGAYPSKGVCLHYHFAKLQVNSLVLRGIQTPSAIDLSVSRRELANTAISCAISTLQTVLNEPDVRASVVGVSDQPDLLACSNRVKKVPIYLHTMITYSSVFLLKVQQKCKALRLGTDHDLIQDLVTQIIAMLTEAKAGERHLSNHIATGLSKMLERFARWESQERLSSQEPTQAPPHPSAFLNHETGCNADRTFSAANTYDTQMPFYDEHYFPMGFFDVLSSAQFDSGLWDQ